MVLSKGKFGTFFSVNFGWGIGVTLGCYWAGGISGVPFGFTFLVGISDEEGLGVLRLYHGDCAKQVSSQSSLEDKVF